MTKALVRLCASLLLLLTASLAVAAPTREGGTILVIPGDSNMRPMIEAVKRTRGDAAFTGITVRILPQSLLSEADIKAFETADVVVARHMVGDIGRQVGPAMKAVLARGGTALGAGSNEGVSAELGLNEDLTLRAYFEAGGADNLTEMLKLVAKREFGREIAAMPPREIPQVGLWEPHSRQIITDFGAYQQSYFASTKADPANPWVALLINRGQALESQNAAVDAIVTALEKREFNVVAGFGFPSQVPIERLLLDEQGKARVAGVVAIGLKTGNAPDKIGPVLERLNVPLINTITLYKATRAEWEASKIGLDLAERSWQISGPEFAGIHAPTVIASKERRADPETGLEYIAELPVPERVDRLADRMRKLVDLRVDADDQKKVAINYYNSPPGAENVGASYLNVMPRSLWQMLARLDAEGFSTTGRPTNEDALFDRLREHGTNIGSWSPGALAKLVASKEAFLLPVADYRRWFDAQPEELRSSMIKAWGQPEDFKVMVWRDQSGRPFFVFPGQRFGNLLFAPQPARGWEEVSKSYHDVSLPPHHQYLAFYLWLQNGFDADAMVHVGTHGTHEWLSGKEVGFTAADPGEAMVGAVPQFYPYIVDVVGEGLQAKRRGMATIISHMTPPFDKAGLNPELVMLRGLLDDYTIAQQKSESASSAKLTDINIQAKKMGLLKDLGLTDLATAADVEKLQHYLEEIGQTQAPFGLHTFGVAPAEHLRKSTALAMTDRIKFETPAARDAQVAEFDGLMLGSAQAELDALVTGLSGRYIAAGVGGDPLRSPASIPTGKNFYGFDPARIPSPGVYEQGKVLAIQLLEDYRRRNGAYPDRLLFNLWSNETMRHEGVLEAEMLFLMGVMPKWDNYGRVKGVEVISREALGRPRVDIIITPSGLYRDTLPGLMLTLDAAVSAVRDLIEPDNAIRANVIKTRDALVAKGITPEQAEKMAAVRMFTQPSGAYGNGLEDIILAGNSWSQESEVIDVYFKRNGHLFGQGFWGDQPEGSGVAEEVFKMALKDVKAVLHSRASNLYGTLDNDDVYQYLGGAAMAVRAVNGKTPETLLVNLGDPARAKTETLDQFLGREMRSRYLNPKWVDAMLKEEYAGARFIRDLADNLWGWQVTVPEAVDAAKWQEMYEVYVADRYNLNVRQRFKDSKNLLAYQALVDRMLVAVNKGYWKADAQTVAALEAANDAAIREAGVSCRAESCSSAKVTAQQQVLDREAMTKASGFGLGAPSALSAALLVPPAAPESSPSAQTAQPTPQPPAPANPTVKGQQLREEGAPAAAPPELAQVYGWLLLLLLLAGAGWQALVMRRERAFSSSHTVLKAA